MAMRGENVRFWLPVVLLVGFAVFISQKLVRSHLSSDVSIPHYDLEKSLPGRRGSIYDAGSSACLLVKSVPVWEYRLDPVALTNAAVRPKGEKRPRTPAAILRTISDALDIDYARLKKMAANTSNRYQYLSQSSDPEAHKILANSRLVAGVSIEERQPRQYLHGRRLSHVLGAVNTQNDPLAGLELRFNRYLSGVPGLIRGKRDGRGRELYDRRVEMIAPIPGADIHLTIDHNLQYEAETALAWGLKEYDAASGWCVILDVATGAVLALASLPDFHPLTYGRATDSARVNRVTNYTYEPGSVMKVITASAGIDSGFIKAHSLYSTDRYDERYYKLPGDGSHKWEPRMTVKDAIVHSSNIVIGKLGYDLGPQRLWNYMKAFGFGERTGIELPGEELGIVRNWKRWDKATWSRAAIGQGVSVTAIQLASAYQAIANNGCRMKPYIIDRVVGSDGSELYRPSEDRLSQPISKATSRTIREMMLDVASHKGTARRAAIRGYSVAGKTGTAQKARNGHYLPGLYCATFCGIVPSGVVKRTPGAASPDPARLVVLVSLDFDKKTRYHQGGNSAAPVFKRIATAALRYLAVEPDRPDELMEFSDEDEFARIMDERASLLHEKSVNTKRNYED